MTHQTNLTNYVASFVAELNFAGVVDVVVSPGSRSTPIAMVMAEHPALRLHIHVDERSAAFFALGIAKATGQPTVLLCTSGTAAANYFPAIAEANLSRVPLVVLTADRPHELRDVGAPQAMEQMNLYGNHVKWFTEMAPPEGTTEMLRYVRNIAARSVATAKGAPAGPVHLNFPLREPLVPDLSSNIFQLAERENGYVKIDQGILTLTENQFASIVKQLEPFQRGIIVCGELAQENFAPTVIQLAEKLGYPIIADPLSQLRSRNHSFVHIMDSYDTFLRVNEAKQQLKPEVIIRFGAMPVSKALTLFLKEHQDTLQLVVDGGAGWRDPSLLSTHMIYCDEIEFCQGLLEKVEKTASNPSYLALWQELNERTKTSLRTVRDLAHLNEAKLYHELFEHLPDGATLFVGNSMPIRDVDTFFWNNEKCIRVCANRGANGIDGVISTALGMATIHQPLYLVVGDLTFFHDLNGLIASKLYDIDLRVIVINNNGGGIFSFLPQANSPKHFERLFGTPLNLDFAPAVSMHGGEFTRISSWTEFTSSFEQNLQKNGLSVVEIPTNRDTNLEDHRNLWKFVSQEISQFLLENADEN